MKKTMLTCDTLDRFEKFINPETLTAEQVQEVEHLAYCANMGAESKESAWTRFCELVKHFLNLDIIDTERHPNIRKAIADHEAETLNKFNQEIETKTAADILTSLFFQAVDFTSVLLRRLDSEKVVYILLSELDVPRPVEYRNGKFVGIVNHAMLRETADFGIVTFFGMGLDKCSVSGIFDGVDPVAFLNRDFLAANNVIDLGVETRCFRHKLKAEKVVTTIDGIFDRDTLCEVVENRFGNDSRIVVDIERSCRSNTTHQLTALDFRAAVNGNLDIVVDILLNDFRDGVLFKLKARSVLPFLTDSIVAFEVIIAKAHHDTIGVELHDFQGGTFSHKMNRKL